MLSHDLEKFRCLLGFLREHNAFSNEDVERLQFLVGEYRKEAERLERLLTPPVLRDESAEKPANVIDITAARCMGDFEQKEVVR